MWSHITAADEFWLGHIGLQFMVVPRPQFLFAFVSLDCSLALNCSFCMEGLLGRTRLSIIARFLAHTGSLALAGLFALAGLIALAGLLCRTGLLDHAELRRSLTLDCSLPLDRWLTLDCLLVIACSCWIAHLYRIAWTLDCLLLVHAISLDYWLTLNCWLMLHLCCKQIKIKLVILFVNKQKL